ncbi:hypothetical protein M1L60_19035 [Actinoplanes sp. TRM 88003]|uniref:Epoxide hydrolase n=1 Tax=Paractinoplanes aksuensis TaxID=2939490 RepID=A0ABT1DPB6_9ACTN|nr:hypothetical protein [Actinoplanes aksuensis]MCO8272692.1 hypothetical protein [Actinoplanes aksuensis]
MTIRPPSSRHRPGPRRRGRGPPPGRSSACTSTICRRGPTRRPERFAQWVDPRSPVDDERLLTDVSLYWLTGTAASSARLARETPRGVEPCPVPVGVAVFPYDITHSVRPLAERLYDIRHWTEFERGGHFAAMEVPAELAADIRRFFSARALPA